MSKFSNYLRALIEQREESITTIARNTGIERTSIHKALKDERVLPYKALQSLARYFGLTLEERQEFFRLHDILLQGEEAYENRQAVCTLINTLAAVDFSMFPPPKVNTLPLTDSLILSLESCISVLAGWILLNQKLSARELSGCVLMFAAIILAQLPSGKKA